MRSTGRSRRPTTPSQRRAGCSARKGSPLTDGGFTVIGAKVIELVEIHSQRLTADVVDDLLTNRRTRGFRAVPRSDLELRVSELLHHLGNWIGDPQSDRTRAEFTEWGRTRFDQGIPL